MLAVFLRHLSEERYRSLTEASPSLIMLLRVSGELVFANAGARKALGLPLEGEVDKDALASRLDEKGAAALADLLSRAAGRECPWAEIYVRLAGHVAPIEFIAVLSPRDEEGGQLVCLLGRDMSRRRSMERELARADRLALIGRLAAGVAHEINNPLGIILANAEYVQKKQDSPQMQAIVRNVERASGITRQLLHLAADSRENTELFDLADVVRESLGFLKPRMHEVAVDMDIPYQLPVRGDRGMLEQLVLNLFLNALDSMEGKGLLTLTGRSGKNGVTLRVRDSGAGIARNDLERIFDVFYTTKGKKGFGMGLFVARNIAERHGGLLWAESEKGRGAEFILELPSPQSGKEQKGQEELLG